MNKYHRYLQKYVSNDLTKKMVFISGPRQAGKTTFVKDLIDPKFSIYLNWDDIDDKRTILARNWSDEIKLVALDEIHKYSRWKNFLKGTYDKQKDVRNFIVTGSARLDLYKKGQDSMVGRFFSWRLHPLCLSELKYVFNDKRDGLIQKLMVLGGFPDPFFQDDLIYAKRWRNERIRLVFRQDINEIENVKDINLLEAFYFLLRERVGSEVVLSNMARDLEIAPKTAKAWLQLLEKTYGLFVVMPFSKNLAKAIVKTPKVYFYDNAEVEGDIGSKFENLVATHLLKKINFLEDSTGDKYELNYLRDRNGHEVDFLVIKNKKPLLLIEAKFSDTNRSKSLYYFKEKLKIEKAVQLVLNPVKANTKDGILVVSADEWLSQKLETSF